jgi:hypothetical protein
MNEDNAKENFIARQIIAEIMNFGVTQQQIMQVIYLLSLELEDREKSVAIAKIIKNSSDLNKTQKGLILDL